jgi:hypothetical protein
VIMEYGQTDKIRGGLRKSIGFSSMESTVYFNKRCFTKYSEWKKA